MPVSHDEVRTTDLDAAAAGYARLPADAADRERLRHDLICRSLTLADRITRRYHGRAEPLEDLRQVARLGLIRSVDRYDPARGSFTAFAVVTICSEIGRHLRHRPGGVDVTEAMAELTRRIGPAHDELTGVLGRTPSTAELAARLRVAEDEVRHARHVTVRRPAPAPLTPVTAHDARRLAQLAAATDAALDQLPDRLAVTGLVRQLPPRIRRILAWRFAGDLTQAEIADRLGISQMHVSRLLRNALAWLRAAMLSDVPPPWTGQEEASPVESLSIDIRQDASAVRVQVRGEIDRDSADRLRHRLHAAVSLASPGHLIVDISGVPLVDAAGAAVLRDAFVSGALSDVEVRFTGLQPYVASVLALLGLPPAAGVPLAQGRAHGE